MNRSIRPEERNGAASSTRSRGTLSDGLLQLFRIDCQRRFCIDSFRRWGTRAVSGCAIAYQPPDPDQTSRSSDSFRDGTGSANAGGLVYVLSRSGPVVATSGYSRTTFVQFVTSERFEVLYDNMKTAVVERNAYSEGQHRFHQGLWDIARHFGFVPGLCQPYRAKTKGKVERFNRYLRYSFYIPLQSRLSQSGLQVDTARSANGPMNN